MEFKGEPRPKVTWYKNEVQLQPTPTVRIVDETHKSTLIIDHVQPSDTDDYICVAENERGVVTSKTTLHVQRKFFLQMFHSP